MGLENAVPESVRYWFYDFTQYKRLCRFIVKTVIFSYPNNVWILSGRVKRHTSAFYKQSPTEVFLKLNKNFESTVSRRSPDNLV